LQSQQTDYFFKVGNELELIYRQVWYEPSLLQDGQPSQLPSPPVGMERY
jgi:biopolymer transport protein ExbB